MSEDYVVYFATCEDLCYSHHIYTKIGSTTNIVNRLCTYKTGYPLRNLVPYCILKTYYYLDIENIFLNEYKSTSTKSDINYVDGGTEWINIILSIDDIINVLEKNDFMYKCEIIHGTDLELYMKNIKKKIYRKNRKNKKKKVEDYKKMLMKIELNSSVDKYNLLSITR